jgi:hypothetical protein
MGFVDRGRGSRDRLAQSIRRPLDQHARRSTAVTCTGVQTPPRAVAMPRALSALYLFDEGLIDSKTANLWADEVWCPSEEETDEEEDL